VDGLSQGKPQGLSRPSLMLPQLTGLQNLTAGLMCKAPLGLWAPHLTRLEDVSVGEEGGRQGGYWGGGGVMGRLSPEAEGRVVA
jgi:hypothetical protein